MSEDGEKLNKVIKFKDFVKLFDDESIRDYDFYFDYADTREYCVYNRKTKQIFFIRETFLERIVRKLKRTLKVS